MINPGVQQKLNELIQNHGRNSLADPVTFESLLQQAAGEGDPDVRLLVTALKSGVPQSLVSGTTDGDALVRKLRDESFLPEDSARATVEGWAAALGAPVQFAYPDDIDPELVHLVPPADVPLPHVEVVIPPSAPIPPGAVTYAAYKPPPQKSNLAAVLVFVILGGLIGAAGLGYFFWSKAQALTTRIDATTPPPLKTTPMKATGSTTVPTVSLEGLTTGNGGTPTAGAGTTAVPKPPQNNPVRSGGDGEMIAYNSKLAEAHRQFLEANDTFAKQNATLDSEQDMNTALDKAAPMWETWSQSLVRIADGLDDMVPPNQAMQVHRKFSDNIRQLSTLIEQVSQAARDHNSAQFEEIGGQIKTFGSSAGQELTNLITAGGFDADQFARDGTLVKKKG